LRLPFHDLPGLAVDRVLPVPERRGGHHRRQRAVHELPGRRDGGAERGPVPQRCRWLRRPAVGLPAVLNQPRGRALARPEPRRLPRPGSAGAGDAAANPRTTRMCGQPLALSVRRCAPSPTVAIPLAFAVSVTVAVSVTIAISVAIAEPDAERES